MPFLRFSRDKRGYETTALVHAVRRDGRSRHRILYWFRTPPSVRVGRPALDQDAIRWIEQQNPDIEFDWPKILEAKPPAAPPADDPRARRRRDRVERSRRSAPAAPQRSASLPPPPPQEPAPFEELVEPEVLPEPLEAIEVEPPPPEPAEPLKTVDAEVLTRLRARYAELLARVTERAGSPERLEALRTQALPLDPDGWVTDAEVRAGVDAFEPRMRDLRSALGLRRRRRSRRGGRRRKPDAPPTPKSEV